MWNAKLPNGQKKSNKSLAKKLFQFSGKHYTLGNTFFPCSLSMSYQTI